MLVIVHEEDIGLLNFNDKITIALHIRFILELELTYIISTD